MTNRPPAPQRPATQSNAPRADADVLAPDAASPAADPGTNRTHPLPDDRADANGPSGEKFQEKSPHKAGQQ